MKKLRNKAQLYLFDALKGDISIVDIKANLTEPRDQGFGDLSFPCFPLSKLYKQSPKDIALELKKRIEKNMDDKIISSVDATGGYLNFNYNIETLTSDVLRDVLMKKENYGRMDMGNNRKVIVEYSSPNFGKPLHVGHIRSTILGDSMQRLLDFSGYDTFGINYPGDIGLHIGKLIVAYDEWGNSDRFEKDPEKEMLDIYVKFCKEAKSDKELDKKAKRVVKEIEEGDLGLTSFWNMIAQGSMKSFDKTYDLLDIKFDEIAGQSRFSDKGKEFVKECLKMKIADYTNQKDNRNDSSQEVSIGVNVDLTEFGLPSKVILRGDGSAIYSTQDLGAAIDRYEKHSFDKMIYVVANEQNLYFKQLFSILEKSGKEWAKDCYHLGFGLIHLPEGKMSTREGQIVLLEELLNKSIRYASEKIQLKGISEDMKGNIAKTVGVGAIKYMVLSVDPLKDFVFSWDKALDFHGKSGPYIQYSYARGTRIVEKHSSEGIYNFRKEDFRLPEEINLIKNIAKFPDVVNDSACRYKPDIMASYLFDVAKNFSNLYRNVRIIGSDTEVSRAALVQATRTTLKNGCNLLGIKVPYKM